MFLCVWQYSDNLFEIFNAITSQHLTCTQNMELTPAIRPYNSCATVKDTRQSVTLACVLPDVKCAFLCGAERCGAGTDAAGHHLLSQVMDLRLKTTVLYTETHTEDTCR